MNDDRPTRRPIALGALAGLVAALATTLEQALLRLGLQPTDVGSFNVGPWSLLNRSASSSKEPSPRFGAVACSPA
ncbi:MAG: hypothetical protein ACR2HY_07680 [Acidimicrobiales bacterium]